MRARGCCSAWPPWSTAARSTRAAEPGSRLGLNFIDSFARIWLLVGGIVVAGAVGSHEDGLAAALVILVAYSIAFAVRIARGREAGPGS